jgi:hypothetical protein
MRYLHTTGEIDSDPIALRAAIHGLRRDGTRQIIAAAGPGREFAHEQHIAIS